MADRVPSDAPPSYDQATGTSGNGSNQAGPSSGSNLEVPGRRDRNGIPMQTRRSMEDERRPLPEGWVRTFDPETRHQFFVDTKASPEPRSIWHHPYDDETYLATLSSEERERIQEESYHQGKKASKSDIMAEHTDEDEVIPSELPPRSEGKGKDKATDKATGLGRKLKDKLTGSTHEERQASRERRAEQERRAYERHMQIRQAMARAAQTGQPQHVGRDADGKDIYIEPPQSSPCAPGYGYGGYGYGYSPYNRGGIYTTQNARYIRPSGPYQRPYGRGFGGGYGTPLALGGGLLGGLLLADVMF